MAAHLSASVTLHHTCFTQLRVKTASTAAVACAPGTGRCAATNLVNETQPGFATVDSACCVLQIGVVHTERGELEQALSTYLEALQHSPENPEILTTLGLTFLRQEEFKLV